MPAKFAKKLSVSTSKDLLDSPEGVTPTPKEKRVSSTTPTPPKRKQTSEKRKTEEGKTEGDSSSQKKRKKTKEGPYTCSLAAGT